MKTQIQTWLGINCGAVLFLCLLVLHGSAIAQASDSLKYFPCDAGDEWLYYVEYSPTQGEFKTIKVDSVLSHPLGRLVYMSGDNERGTEFVVDTANGFIYGVFSGENPDSVDSLPNVYRLDAQVGNYWRVPVPYAGVSAMFDTTVFGVRRKIKEFSLFGTFQGDTTGGQDHNPDTWFSYFSEQYAYGIGMTYRYVEPGEGWFLVGAIIDGDTLGTLMAVNEKKNNVPRTIQLNQNYPNPFNPTTVIQYQLPKDTHVTLKIYDILGRVVATLVDGEETAGPHEVVFDGSRFASSVYFYRLSTPTYSKIQKMILMK